MRGRSAIVLGFGLAAGCTYGSQLFLPPPDFEAEGSIFWVADDPAQDLVVFAYPALESASVQRLFVAEGLGPSTTLFAFHDRHTLDAHGILAGRLPGSESGKALPTERGRQISLVEGAQWSPAEPSLAVLGFRFASLVSDTPCARLEKVAEHSADRILPSADAVPVLVALEGDRFLAVPTGGTQGMLVSVQTSSIVDLMPTFALASPRAAWRHSDGRLFFGDHLGLVRSGTLESGLAVTATIPTSTPASDPPASAFRAIEGSRGAAAFELYAVTFGYVAQLEPAQRILYERDLNAGGSRQDGAAAWLGPGRLLAAAPNELVTWLFEEGERRGPFLISEQVSGMAGLGDLGAFAVTRSSRLLKWDEARDDFVELARNAGSNNRGITTDGERVFLFSTSGVIQQYVPGTGVLCPDVSAPVPLGPSNLVATGSHLAKQGPTGRTIEIWAITSPTD